MHGDRRGAYRILVGKPEGRRALGRPRHRWQDNMKTDLREVGWGYAFDRCGPEQGHMAGSSGFPTKTLYAPLLEKGRRGRNREQLLNGLRKRRRYWKLKQENCNTICGELALEEALDPS